MDNKQVTILTGDPTVAVVAEMQLAHGGIDEMVQWVGTHRPECLPWDGPQDRPDFASDRVQALFPHDLRRDGPSPAFLTDNELLVELAGRKCYDSFGLKAGKKTNAAYIANTQMHVDPRAKAADVVMSITDDDCDMRSMDHAKQQIAQAIADAQNTVPHASILYHAKMSFFIAGVSRRVSHELIRNYVGADRDEEGSPSQESTRYTHHYGFYVAHPKILAPHQPSNEAVERKLGKFRARMQQNYEGYLEYIDDEVAEFAELNGGRKPNTQERKEIYESASPYLSHSCETSFVWTTNPMALAKMFKERDNAGADKEFRRLARKWKRVCMQRWPNLFPQPWMQDAR